MTRPPESPPRASWCTSGVPTFAVVGKVNMGKSAVLATLLEEDDVDVMAWALKTAPTPPRFQGELMAAMQRLDYVDIPR